jgi:hypothetical protein
LWYRSKKTSKLNSFTALYGHPWAFSEPIVHKTCVSLEVIMIGWGIRIILRVLPQQFQIL